MVGLLVWFGLGLFCVVALYRVVRFASMPLHLRWELYPMPLDPRFRYGGSYMEEVRYVEKPRPHVKLNGLRALAAEVLLLKGVREHNRYGLWLFSLMMHWGLYLLFGWMALLAVECLLGLDALAGVTQAVWVISAVLGTAGTLGLVLRRATSRELATYTAPVDYLHLLWLMGIFAAALGGWLTRSGYAATVHLLTGGAAWHAGLPAASVALAAAHLVLLALFLVYMPFSRLFHYAAKYFTIDRTLWDDALNTRGSEIEQQVNVQLQYPVTWSAPHIGSGGTWADAVAVPDAREGKA